MTSLGESTSPCNGDDSRSPMSRRRSSRLAEATRSSIEQAPFVSREFAIMNAESHLLSKEELQECSQAFSLKEVGRVESRIFGVQEEGEDVEKATCGCCLCWATMGKDSTAQGYALLGIARGSILMANVFLSAALIHLANLEAGCIDETTNEIISECTGKAYGFAPASLVTNIAVITGLLGAFFSPVVGAVIDYTPYRRQVGIATAAVAIIVQAVQIYTTERTWFPMSILQAIVGAFVSYQHSQKQFILT